MRKARDNQNDTCTRNALESRKKAFETLNDSSQQNSKHASVQDLTATRYSQYGNKEHIMKLTEVPIDPKPDIVGIQVDRTEQAKKTLISNINEATSKPKKSWRRSIEYAEKDSKEGPITSIFSKIKRGVNMARTRAQLSVSQTQSLSKSQSFSTRPKTAERVMSAVTRTTVGISEVNTQTFPTLEAKEPGVGDKIKGSALKRVTAEILHALDEDIVEKVYERKRTQLTMPDIKRDQLWLNKHIPSMECSDFWLQKGVQCSKEGKAEAALDYYRQGLRKNPNDQILLFSLALGYLQLQKFESAIRWFSFGLKLEPRWIDGLCGVAIAFFNI